MAGRLTNAQESGLAGGEACNGAGFALSNEAFAVSKGGYLTTAPQLMADYRV